MINQVYEMALSLLNKNNYGYMTPQDFNLFAEQAQLDIFEDLFYDYNMQITKEMMRKSGTGYADITKGVEEVIAIFSDTQVLDQPVATLNTANIYNLPPHYYFINKIYYYPDLLFSGTTSASAGYTLIDATLSPFTVSATNPNPPIGSVVVNTSPAGAPLAPMLMAYVTSVNSTSQLSLSEDIMATGQNYNIYNATNITQVEKVSQNKIFNLTSSLLTAPNTQYPAYVASENQATVYPSTINNKGDVVCQYIRYPLTPRWTSTQVGVRPIFDQSSQDYQNFELPLDYFQDLVSRILQYGGLTIREVQAVQYGQALETGETTEEMQK